MAEKHPYMSGGGAVIQAVTQFRKAFPPDVTAETLRKLGIAPNNETYLLNILRFVGVLDAEGKPTAEAKKVFTKHEDDEFSEAFAALVKDAYKELFSLHHDSAWTLPTSKLISFFRSADGTSDIVGKRQASTFQTLAALSGHAEVPTPRTSATRTNGKKVAATKNDSAVKVSPKIKNVGNGSGKGAESGSMGLTVRIEVNLPAGGDKDTYDAIFKSIRENLLGGK